MKIGKTLVTTAIFAGIVQFYEVSASTPSSSPGESLLSFGTGSQSLLWTSLPLPLDIVIQQVFYPEAPEDPAPKKPLVLRLLSNDTCQQLPHECVEQFVVFLLGYVLPEMISCRTGFGLPLQYIDAYSLALYQNAVFEIAVRLFDTICIASFKMGVVPIFGTPNEDFFQNVDLMYRAYTLVYVGCGECPLKHGPFIQAAKKTGRSLHHSPSQDINDNVRILIKMCGGFGDERVSHIDDSTVAPYPLEGDNLTRAALDLIFCLQNLVRRIIGICANAQLSELRLLSQEELEPRECFVRGLASQVETAAAHFGTTLSPHFHEFADSLLLVIFLKMKHADRKLFARVFGPGQDVYSQLNQIGCNLPESIPHFAELLRQVDPLTMSVIEIQKTAHLLVRCGRNDFAITLYALASLMGGLPSVSNVLRLCDDKMWNETSDALKNIKFSQPPSKVETTLLQLGTLLPQPSFKFHIGGPPELARLWVNFVLACCGEALKLEESTTRRNPIEHGNELRNAIICVCEALQILAPPEPNPTAAQPFFEIFPSFCAPELASHPLYGHRGLPTDAPEDKDGFYRELSPQETQNIRLDMYRQDLASRIVALWEELRLQLDETFIVGAMEYREQRKLARLCQDAPETEPGDGNPDIPELSGVTDLAVVGPEPDSKIPPQ
jgi:hypothetical protein